MSEFDQEVKKAEQELNQGLVPLEQEFTGSGQDEFLGDLKMQAQEYGAKIQDAAAKARDFATEKFKDLQGKDPKMILEDAKDYARKEPGKALLITAVAGVVLGFLLKRR